jgi:hypothetical protein
MGRRLGAAASVSAVTFGLLTWSIAHALTYLLFAHIHVVPTPVVHMHGGPGPTLIAAGGMLAAAALATTMIRRLARPRPGAARPVAAVVLSSWIALCAPSAFVLIELAQHFAGGEDGPPPTLLLIGIVVHTAMGAATPVLWTRLVQGAVGVLLVPGLPDDPARLWRASAFPVEDWTTSRTATPLGSRGPPAGAHDTVVTACLA